LTPKKPSGQLEHRFTGTDGRPRWYLWRNSAFFDSEGRLLGYQAVGTDIAERKQAEQRLKDGNRHLEAILNNIPDFAWLKDRESRFIAVNESFASACGVSPADLVGKSDLDIWPEELACSYRVDDREVLRTCKRKIVEERLVDRAGNQRWIETIKTPILNEKNKAIGTTGIAREITRRREMEAALRRSEGRIRAITDALPSQISYVDKDGTCRFSNKACEEHYGISSINLIGRNIREVMGEENYEKAAPQIAKVLAGQRVRYGFCGIW
jgi:PAS domain S-box-containing protein